MLMKILRSPGLLLAAAFLFTGCASFNLHTKRNNTSLAQYLYPTGNPPPDKPTIPTLSLPLRVGVAWVPSYRDNGRESTDTVLTEIQKTELLNQVVPHFQTYNFVRSVEIIPTPYLTPGGGFENLNQLRAMFDVDVIALISYDQVQMTHQDLLSLTYWTVVGSYVFEGERNDTHTMIDAAVYDIASRKMLFRAPGISRVKAGSTPVNQKLELRRDSEKGFKAASTNMVANLTTALDNFRVRVKQSPEEYKVVYKKGGGFEGAMGWPEIAGLLMLAVLALNLRKPRTA